MKTEFTPTGVTLHLSFNEARHLYRYALTSHVRKIHPETFNQLVAMHRSLPPEEPGPRKRKHRP